ncbi:short-chain dehydrogenase/reductase SDR [Lujinxingia litoralis]|uniref:Short-chain dehydrogenase/reductase SDR n=1 Tax=Lujinxingia litoralis TaxID=2211119 RepID=A0A328C521_9DELT|nr:SDR family oxidoreductase [Lujinxingia litoralis]RAL20120.1 short-chain dehydrogenase/reductase SDR [Lujinxingia litoralis]
MSLLSAIKGRGPSGYGYGSTAEEVCAGVDLSGKTVLITGCNSGIGKESFRVLAARGAHVIAAARTVEKAQATAEELGFAGQASAVACELSEPASVFECVTQVKGLGRSIDVLMLNAGIMALPTLTLKCGYELQFFTNHIGHFILATGLLDTLSEDARVVVLSSAGHQMTPRGGIDFENLDGSKGYDAWKFYGQSKLANLLFARELARKFEGTKRTANAVHPGVINTNLTRHMHPFLTRVFGLFESITLKSVAQGAATQCYVAVHPDVTQSGKYFADCDVAGTSRYGQDMELAARLWDESERIVEGL